MLLGIWSGWSLTSAKSPNTRSDDTDRQFAEMSMTRCMSQCLFNVNKCLEGLTLINDDKGTCSLWGEESVPQSQDGSMTSISLSLPESITRRE